MPTSVPVLTSAIGQKNIMIVENDEIEKMVEHIGRSALMVQSMRFWIDQINVMPNNELPLGNLAAKALKLRKAADILALSAERQGSKVRRVEP